MAASPANAHHAAISLSHPLSVILVGTGGRKGERDEQKINQREEEEEEVLRRRRGIDKENECVSDEGGVINKNGGEKRGGRAGRGVIMTVML